MAGNIDDLDAARQLAASLVDLEELDGFMESNIDYNDLAALLGPVVQPLPWLDAQFLSAQIPSTTSMTSPSDCLDVAALLTDPLTLPSLACNSADSEILASDFSAFTELQFNSSTPDLTPESLLLLPNSQRSSFSSLDVPSPHGSASDISLDRASSPGIDWPGAGSDDDHRGAELLASLTSREREILESKGLNVRGALPLTKEEEKRIRAERRKIRNKDSAKESRRKKAEYMQVLEKRAEASTQLKQRCDALEKENAGLLKKLAQMQKYLTELTRTLPNTGAGFPLMMLLMTFCFAFAPSFLTGPNGGLLSPSVEPAVVKSRVLLSIPDTCADPRPSTSPLLMRPRVGLTDRFSWLSSGRLSGKGAHMHTDTPMERAGAVPEILTLTIAPEDDDNDVVDPSNETQQAPAELDMLFADPFATGPKETPLPSAHFLLRDTLAQE